MKTLKPIDSLQSTLAFAPRDWGENKRDAWLWGVINGWDEEVEEGETQSAMDEICKKHNWNDIDRQRLITLHKNFMKLKEQEDKLF